MNTKRGRKKEGFLNVKLSSRSALGKAWKRKWVVVQQNTTSTGKSLLLELYTEKGAYHKTVTSLLLEGVVRVQRTTSKKQEHAVEISSASKVLLAVSADSEAETQEWLGMFRISLLQPAKELACPPGIPEDFMRVSVIPNKDSERLKLIGDYFAHISLASINLYDTHTGGVVREWDLRHLKKFMLISKCHQLDAEKIVHILPSNRSPHGEGEFIFFGAKGKQLVEGIYDRLSNAMTVKSRRSRSTSMLFEITPQELEQMFKDGEQPAEEVLKEANEDETAEEEKEKEEEDDKEGKVNGEATANEVSHEGKGMQAEEVTKDPENKDIESASSAKEDAEAKVEEEAPKEEAPKEDGPAQEEGKIEQLGETEAPVEDAEQEVQLQNGGVEASPPETSSEDVTQRSCDASVAAESRDGAAGNLVSETEEAGSADRADLEDDKANQTNPEEMDGCLGDEEPTASNVEVVESSQSDNSVDGAIETTKAEQVESRPGDSEPMQEVTPEVITADNTVAEESVPVPIDTRGDATPGESPGEKVIEDNDVGDAKIEESPRFVSETEQASSDSQQEASEELKNTELESGSQEEETGVENSILQKESVEGDATNPAIHPASDLQEQTAEQSCEAKGSPPIATGESVSVEQDEAAEVVDATEPVKDSPQRELDQGASGELSEPANAERSPGTAALISVPPESTPENATDSREPVQAPPEEGPSGGSADVPNPNHNNSNANLPSTPTSKSGVPLPNTPASRMTEAGRRAQRQKLPTEGSPSQKTQTDIPPDQPGSDQPPEIIV